MIHDEDTKEIELPGIAPKDPNVVKVDFAIAVALPSQNTRGGNWLKDLSPANPWAVRLFLVVLILVLSLLVL